MLQWQTKNLPLRAGLSQKSDDRARAEPFLDIAKDIQFDETGGVQTRLPFGPAESNIFGGGTITNARRIETVNGERVLFTDQALYTWNAQLSKWILRGTHLAVSVDESPVFTTPGDQIDEDRAELNGTVVFVWIEGAGAARSVYAAALDKTTKAVLVAPTAIAPANAFAGIPRVVALATKILLFAHDGSNNLKVRAIDPADPATGFASAATTVLAASFFGQYDVVRVEGADQCVGACNRNPTTSYTAFTVTAGLTVATSTKARTCDGPIAVASTPDGSQVQIARGVATAAKGDLLTISTLADMFTDQALGAAAGFTMNQITASFVGTTCTVIWSTDETTGAGSTTFATKTNTVTTANVVGTQAVLVSRLGLASRAFTRSGAVYVWLIFAEESAATGLGVGLGIRQQQQNAYLLYRADGHLAAKAVYQLAGGYSPTFGHLPGVQATSGTGNDFAWCGAIRRRIELGGETHSGYAARAPVDITFSFDSNEARRCARLGRTLYISGGILLQYDGFQIVEVGFVHYPWTLATQNPGVPGNLAAGSYNWKSTYKWTNGQGEVERSTTAVGEQQTIGAPRFIIVSYPSIFVTRKVEPRPITIEFWRTIVNAPEDSSYYLINSQDPNTLTGDNPFVPNVTIGSGGGVFNDNYADATLITKEQNPENGDVLESLSPPGANVIIASDTRLFLWDVDGDPDNVWYSRQRQAGEIASFHENLRAQVPRDGGRATALAIHNETLVVFRETAVYRMAGEGFDNFGHGQNLVAFEVASDIGAVSHEAIGKTPLGTIFKSRKGWYLLTPGWQPQYIGSAVTDYDSETVLSVDVIETQHQVRILTANRMLVWDYMTNPYGDVIGQWGEMTIADGVHSTIWNGSQVYLTATGPRTQLSTYTGLTYGIDVETAWIKFADLQGAAKCRWFAFVGEWRSDFLARIRVARDYQYDGAGNPAYFDDEIWTPDTALVGNVLQVRHTPSVLECEALKVRFTAVTDAARATLVTTALSPQVTTSGTVWNATLRAVYPGAKGNRITMTIAFLAEDDPIIDELPVDLPFTFGNQQAAITVNDHFTWSVSLGRWREQKDNIGVLIFGSPLVSEIESVIVAKCKLATLQSADATPSKTIAMTADSVSSGAFTGGAYGSPTGEACKLTGLALDVGIRPGINRQLPESKKVA